MRLFTKPNLKGSNIKLNDKFFPVKRINNMKMSKIKGNLFKLILKAAHKDIIIYDLVSIETNKNFFESCNNKLKEKWIFDT